MAGSSDGDESWHGARAIRSGVRAAGRSNADMCAYLQMRERDASIGRSMMGAIYDEPPPTPGLRRPAVPSTGKATYNTRPAKPRKGETRADQVARLWAELAELDDRRRADLENREAA
jgi:hypothetical protein